MNKAVAWSIKGVDFDAREAAREAADRAGMSLGEWLNEVISERAAELGESPDDFDDEDRLTAVARRLSRMRGGRQEGAGREGAGQEGAQETKFDMKGRRRVDARRAREVDDDEAARPQRRQPGRPHLREIPFAEGERAELLLERAIGAFERRAHRASERTARAIAEMATMIETAQERASVEGEALNVISDRLAEIERRMARSVEKDTSRPIRGALSRLETRLEELTRRSETQPEDNGMREIEDKLSEIAARLDKAPVAARAEPDRIVQLETRIAALSSLVEEARRPQPAPERKPLADAVAEIAARQRQLDGAAPRPFHDMRRPAAPVETDRLAAAVEKLERRLDQPAPAIAGLQGDIARMANHIEQMREEISRGAPAPLAAVEAPLDQIRSEIAGVSRALGDLAPRASVAALERAMRDVADQLAHARSHGEREVNLAPMEALVRELRAGISQIDARDSIAALERDVRAVAAKLDNLESAGVDPRTIAAIHEQTRDMRELLTRAAAAMPVAGADRELAAIAEKIARGGKDGAADMQRLANEIRAMVADPRAGVALQALEQRIDALSSRIDAALSANAGAEQFAAFGERLDMLQRAVAQSLNAPRAAAGADMRHMESLVADLAQRIERASAPGGDGESVAELQRQVERLASKLEGTTDPAAPLASLQRAVAGIFDELESTRRAALEAAQQAAGDAARAAARETMREAMTAIESQRDRTVDPTLVREIADLRAVQGVTEQRTHDTLTAVHQTLERMVDRLATLEQDVGAVRTAKAPTSPAPAAAAPSQPVRPAPEARPKTELTPALPPSAEDFLIEPGVGLNRVAGARGRAAEAAEPAAQASFIAAARRAAKAAQAPGASGAAPGADGEALAGDAAPAARAGAVEQVRALYEKRKRPILLGLAAVVMMLGALQVVGFLGGDDRPAPAQKSENVKPDAGKPDAKGAALDSPKRDAAEPRKPAEARSNAPADTSANAPASAPAALPPPQAALPAQPSAAPAEAPPILAQPPQRRADAPVDSQPVGAIARPDARDPARLQALAARGDAAAQYELAVRFADQSRDFKNAAHWFEKSAAKGLAPAQYRLGVLYERGLGVTRDPALARSWYQRAAERGNARAMHNLAVLLADGGGAKPEYSEAAIWFRKAAERGVKDSQYNLAILYARGMGVAQDLVESYGWFAAAAAQGDGDAGKKRDEVAGRLDAGALARARDIAASFRPLPLEPAANEVASPAPEPPKDVKPAARPKVSRL